MKIAIKDIKDNPYRKKVGDGTYNLEQINKIASTLEDIGLVGSLPVYINDKTKLRIRCKEGHLFEIASNYMKKGGWCSMCAEEKKRLKRSRGK